MFSTVFLWGIIMLRYKPIFILICICFILSINTCSFADVKAAKTPEGILNIFDHNGSVMLVVDSTTGKIVNANQAASDFYGYSIETLLTMNVSEINVLTAEEIKLEMNNAISQSRNYFNFKHRLRSGEIRDVEVYSYPYASDKGDHLLLSTVYDVTWKIEAEAEARNNRMIILALLVIMLLISGVLLIYLGASRKGIRSSREKYQSLFVNMREGFAIHEMIFDEAGNPLDYRFIEVNDSFEAFTGLARNMIKGKTVKELNLNIEQYWIERYGKVVLTGEPDHFVEYSGGIGKWFSVSVYRPSIGKFATLFSDISEEKSLQQSLTIEKNLLETTLVSIADGVISIDGSGKIDIMNPTAEQLTGYFHNEAQGLDFYNIFQLFDEQNGEPCLRDFYELVHNTDLQTGVILRNKGERMIPIEFTASPIRTDGQYSGVIIVFRDYTEKREREERILYLSYHDQLTGLYNRRFFEEEINRLDTQRNLPWTLAVCDVNGLKLTNDAFGHLAGDALLKNIADLLTAQCRAEDLIARIGGDEFAILLPQTDSLKAGDIVKRIYSALSESPKEKIVHSLSIGWYTKVDPVTTATTIFMKAEEEMYRKKLTESQSMRNQTIKVILDTLYKSSDRERLHSEGVKQFAMVIGEILGLDYDTLNDLETASLLHDIGKIAINLELLERNMPLKESELIEIRKHPESSYQILKSVDRYSSLSEYVLSHHERWDGKGYPRQLEGEQIPLISRIISIADALDAITSGRPHSEKRTFEDALEEIRDNAGTQFDPSIVEKFLGHFRVRLSLK